MINAVLFDLFETLITELAVQPTRASSLAPALGLENEAYRREWKARRPRIVDALQLMSDRGAVLKEVGRIVKRGGRFAFTTWLSRQAGIGPPFPVDYQPLLEAAGFSLQWCHEPSDWEQRESAVFARIRESAERLSVELGSTVATMLVTEATKMPEAYSLIRRVNIVARRE